MSREIKFRAWLIGSERMLDNVGFDNTSESDAVVEYMQYTGLKDKNGKEIYQSDIIECVGERYTVDWHFNRWVLRDNKGKLNEFHHLNFEAGWYEIVGNTYED